MKLPGGILTNKATGRFHPIVFRWGPAPSGPLDGGVERYKSLGHHTDGFDTLEEAQATFKEGGMLSEGYYDSGMQWMWGGDDIPAIVAWFGPYNENA